ncbi:hypothetical protein [Streptomyces sp. NPDC087859]|uniref:hypothetical protein n=1 Tax=Streptomyces sp. NPDC087859 TaxID=3365812 RepID=UPI003809E467
MALAAAVLAVGGLATTAQAAPAATASSGAPTLVDVYVWATDVGLRRLRPRSVLRRSVAGRVWPGSWKGTCPA